jgi:hypothetical protein
MSPLTCPGDNCPYCSGLICNACKSSGRPRPLACNHDSVERHSSIPAIQDDEPSIGRVPTKPIPPIVASSVVFELEDGSQVGEFLEHVIKCTRSGKRIKITVECVD